MPLMKKCKENGRESRGIEGDSESMDFNVTENNCRALVQHYSYKSPTFFKNFFPCFFENEMETKRMQLRRLERGQEGEELVDAVLRLCTPEGSKYYPPSFC